MSDVHPDRGGQVDPTHVGPPDLILQEILAPGEVPEEVRRRVEAIAENARRWPGGSWADVTFAGRALALIEGTDQPDYDASADALVWVFALSAESPALGEMIVSVGGFASSSSEIRFDQGQAPQRGNRVSVFSAIETTPRVTPTARP